MCKVLEVSRSGYYEWLNRKISTRTQENMILLKEIKKAYKESKNRYGSPKITAELKSKGFNVSRPRVARHMKSANLKSIIQKKYKVCTTDSKHRYPVAENVLNRKFDRAEPNEVWVSDITYIPTLQGFLYLTTIMDLYDLKIIGWATSTTMTTKETIIPAWKMAISNRPVTQKSLIFHFDRGSQYASNNFRKEITKRNVTQSMSRAGNCWDNAVAENFFKILKSELVYHEKHQSIKEARLSIFNYIEIWYIKKRRHSYLGYLTPDEFGKQQLSNVA